jgi:hypothetical protein
VSDDYKIYVDAGRPATLNNGAGVLTDYPTLQEVVLAWRILPLINQWRTRAPSWSNSAPAPRTRSVSPTETSNL